MALIVLPKEEGEKGAVSADSVPVGCHPKRSISIPGVRWSSMNPAVRARYAWLVRLLGSRPQKPLIADANQARWRRQATPRELGEILAVPCRLGSGFPNA